MNTETFIKKATERRGNELFDYSKVIYTKTEEPIVIICKEHGDFVTTPHRFIRNANCPECSKINRAKIGRSNTEEFIKKAVKVHGDKYDYSEVDYKTSYDKVKIYCSVHDNIFKQSPNSHLAGQECPMCGKAKGHNNKMYTQEEFIKAATEKHKGKYDYSLVKYKGCFDTIKIICHDHGVFEQKSGYHLFKTGCPTCGLYRDDSYKERYAKQFIEKVIIKHNNFFDYSKTKYKGAHNKITITCPFHGDLVMKANTHLNGTGCRYCSKEKSGFGRSNFVDSCKGGKAIFYLLEFYNETERFYKIGITGKSIKVRYAGVRDCPYEYTILKEIEGSPEDTWALEKLNLKLLNQYKYQPFIGFHGKTECLTLSALDKIKFELE